MLVHVLGQKIEYTLSRRDWYIVNRNIDSYCMNSLDSAAMVNWLNYLGNEKAELIISSGKGYRLSRNIRHPHSWSIADAKELISWITKQKTTNSE